MKGFDQTIQGVEKKVSKLARDVVSAGASGMSAGTMGLGANPLQQAFIGLGLGENLMAEGGTPTPNPTQTKGALEVRL